MLMVTYYDRVTATGRSCSYQSYLRNACPAGTLAALACVLSPQPLVVRYQRADEAVLHYVASHDPRLEGHSMQSFIGPSVHLHDISAIARKDGIGGDGTDPFEGAGAEDDEDDLRIPYTVRVMADDGFQPEAFVLVRAFSEKEAERRVLDAIRTNPAFTEQLLEMMLHNVCRQIDEASFDIDRDSIEVHEEGPEAWGDIELPD
jgi:hypothetical protein